MKRPGGMLRRTPLQRHTRMRRRNPDRLAARRALQFGAQAALCRTLPCYACGAPPPSDPHHSPTTAAGGLDGDTVPLCRRCHRLLDSPGWSERRLEQERGIDIRAEARRLRQVVQGGAAC